MTLEDIERAAIEAACAKLKEYGLLYLSGDGDKLSQAGNSETAVIVLDICRAYEREMWPHREYAALERAVDRMGWPEIHAYHEERKKGQAVTEDAGGFVLRGLGRLFGVDPKREVETYQAAARRMIESLKREDAARPLPKREG